MSDSVSRFTSKATIYSRYRWPFAPHSIEMIFATTGLSGAAIIADLGAGTGMLSRHFVDRVNQVLAVEPNADMRQEAENSLGRHPNFRSLNGYAHATGLTAQVVDLIVVGRAIHWFEPESTRKEFLRILKPGGWLAILQVPCTDEALLQAIRSMRTRSNGWKVGGDKSARQAVPLSFYYGSDNFTSQQFPATVQETWPEFLGRLTSISSAPDEDHPQFPDYRRAARKIFDRFSKAGCLTIQMATELSLGQLCYPA